MFSKRPAIFVSIGSECTVPQKETIHPNAELFLEELFRKYYKDLLRYTTVVLTKHGGGYVSDSERAHDVVQDVFMLAWEKRETLMESESPVGWLYKAAVYKVREALRDDRAWIRRLSQAEEILPVQELSRTMPEDWEDCISREDFELLCRVYLDGYTYKELCEEMGLKKSALAMRLNRAKARFQKNYGKINQGVNC